MTSLKLPYTLRIADAVVCRASVIARVDAQAGTVRLASGDELAQAVPGEIAGPGDAVLVTDRDGGSPQVVSRVDFGQLYRDPTNAELDAQVGPPEPPAPGSAGRSPVHASTTLGHGHSTRRGHR